MNNPIDCRKNNPSWSYRGGYNSFEISQLRNNNPCSTCHEPCAPKEERPHAEMRHVRRKHMRKSAHGVQVKGQLLGGRKQLGIMTVPSLKKDGTMKTYKDGQPVNTIVKVLYVRHKDSPIPEEKRPHSCPTCLKYVTCHHIDFSFQPIKCNDYEGRVR